MRIVKEHFDSIHQLLNVLETRPNNAVMSGCNSSTKSDESFTGTKNWAEAVELFQNGYSEVLDQIKSGVVKNVNSSQIENCRHVRTGVVGYAPHVPNAIQSLPNSMIYTEHQPQKVKAISIYYAPTANCFVPTETFVKSGIAMLSAVNMLEKSGIRVNLNIVLFGAGNDGESELTFATVKVKDYKEHMDILKLCFPVVHPSLFRRFGFKWLETCPDIKAYNWRCGYGHENASVTNKLKKEVVKENEYMFTLQDIEAMNFEPEAIVKAIK